jgi:oxygen-independent coproporphyrinogen III oxidase
MQPAGIYIHVPFCRARCSYCDFATGTYQQTAAARYVSALIQELTVHAHAHTPVTVDTIYFGGGTPSLLTPAQVEAILCVVHEQFRIARDVEVTMEMNPGTVTPETLRAYRALGVNRASFGLQTFDDEQLRRLGRTHTAADARRTFAHLRAAGFDNISFDLIAGLPAQTVAEWAHNLDEALALRPEHLSLYLLEVHEGTPLAEQLTRGMWPQPDADVAAEMYRLLLARMTGAAYEHYEISNFARPGFASRHNLKYWTGAPYYGFGNSAHSYDGARLRWANERDAARYVELIEANQRAVVETVALDEHDASAEALFTGLRLMRGVDLSAHRARFGTDVRAHYDEDLRRFSEAGLIELDDDRLRLTPAGVLLSNEIFAAFV